MLYRVESIVFGAAFVWCALYLLSSTAPPSNNVSYGITILGLASFVAAMTANRTEKAYYWYAQKVKEKGINFSNVSNKKEAAQPEIGKDSAVRSKADFELNVDLIRYAGAMIVAPLAVFALYNMLPLGEGDFLQGRGLAVMLIVLGMLAVTVSKLLVFDFQYKIEPLVQVINAIVLLGGAACLLIVLVDILTSAKHSPIESNIWFFCLTGIIGYGFVYILVLAWRLTEINSPVRDVRLDTLKHILFVVIDVLIMGFLVYGSIMDAYQRPFTDTRFFLTTPEIVLSPPPPLPPPSPPPVA